MQGSGLVFRFYQTLFDDFDHTAQTAGFRDRLLSATQQIADAAGVAQAKQPSNSRNVAVVTGAAPIQTISDFARPRGNISQAFNIRNIEISGNKIVDAPGVAIKLVNADGVLVQNNTLINPLSGLAGGKRLEFSGSLPAVAINDLMRKPYFGIVTISSRNVRGSRNRAENAPPVWRGMIGVGAWSENIHID